MVATRVICYYCQMWLPTILDLLDQDLGIGNALMQLIAIAMKITIVEQGNFVFIPAFMRIKDAMDDFFKRERESAVRRINASKFGLSQHSFKSHKTAALCHATVTSPYIFRCLPILKYLLSVSQQFVYQTTFSARSSVKASDLVVSWFVFLVVILTILILCAHVALCGRLMLVLNGQHCLKYTSGLREFWFRGIVASKKM